ncbi:MAG: cyclic nucleotide-binding domain-containing protein, partial [Clostridia bacterium]|nr:cyclic nucleotide-binding domain-containing protein [Clostridia bacterium]
MIEKWLPILTRCGIFEGLQASDILDMMPCFQPAIKTYAKEDIIIRIGDLQDTFGVVLEGEIIVQKEDYSGNRLIMGTFGPTELFGEVAAFAKIGTWPNMVVANSRCQVLFLPIVKFT